jgi:uncharacterized repeat protein (TIGR03803 family)
MRDLRLHGFCASAIVLAFSLSLLSTSALATSREQVIYPFYDCSGSIAPLIVDGSGNLYGTNSGGGAHGGGCIFKLSLNPDGSWSESVLYSFSGNDGKFPSAALVFDKVGNLYGTTRQGGLYGGGLAFELSPSPGGTWTETVLHNFGNGSDGSGLSSELVFDAAGNLYGTTELGGVHHGGTVFKLSPSPNGWTETVLHAFLGRGQGPISPAGGVVIDSAGNLYGVTSAGGNKGVFGAAYELVPKNGAYVERTIHSFDGSDGRLPGSTLVMDSSGNLYGSTWFGGSLDLCPPPGCGTVFELTKDRGGKWTETVLYSLGDNGYIAVGPVVFDSAGNLYAAAMAGGFEGQGSVFKLTPQRGGSWRETALHLFHYLDSHYRTGRDGQQPHAGVIVYEGQLFGTTISGGIHDEGTVFSIRLAHP